MRTVADAVVIVIPVHNDEVLLTRCLLAARAAAHPLRRRGLMVRVVTVLDDCRDDSGSIATRLRHSDDVVVEVGVRSVGRARDAGVDVGLDGLRSARPPWIVCTDADTVAGPSWLTEHLRLRAAGLQCVAGGVALTDLGQRSDDLLRRWQHHTATSRRRARVYGANLGIGADALADIGGVPHLESGEDQSLWDLVGAAGRPRTARPDLLVATSARRTARAPHGLHRFLDALDQPHRQQA